MFESISSLIVIHHRTVKKLFSLLLFIILSITTSCSPDLELTDFRAGQGVVDPFETGRITFDSSKGEASIKIEANKTWSIEPINNRASSWLSVTPDNGKRSGIVSIQVSENDTYAERNATLVFRCKDITKSIIITQKQNDAILISSDRQEISSEGGDFTIDVMHNINYSVIICDDASDWLRQVETRSMETDAIHFLVSPNLSANKRQGSIKIASSQGSETVAVYQSGATPSLVLSCSEFHLGRNESEIRIEVQSNAAIEYSISSDWITENIEHAESTNTYYFIVQNNNEYYERCGTITFFNKEFNLQEEIIVYQAQNDIILLNDSDVYVPSNGGTVDISLRANVDFSYRIDNSVSKWIRSIETKSLSDYVIQLGISPNDTYNPRTGKITFSNEAIGISENMYIHQAQNDAVILGNNSLSFGWEKGSKQVEVKSNVDYSVKLSQGAADWVTVSNVPSTKGLETKGYVITVSENSGARREATVLFSSSSCSETITIEQDNAPIVVDNASIELYCLKGASESVNFNSAGEWDIVLDNSSSISVSSICGTSGFNSITVSANSANITNDDIISSFSIVSNGYSTKVIVKQVPAFKFDTLDSNISALGGSIRFYCTIPRKDYSVVHTADYDDGFADMLNSLGIPSFSNSSQTDSSISVDEAQVFEQKIYMQYNIKANCSGKTRHGKFRLYFIEDGQVVTSEWVNVTQNAASGYSKDYSSDGNVRTLCSHSIGNGIPVVIVGDGFRDTDIASGKYDNAMNLAYNYFFSVEPMASLKDLFDVWAITVVSPSSDFGSKTTRFQTTFGSGTHIDGDDDLAYRVGSLVVPSNKRDDMLVIVVLNSTVYAGTCYIHYWQYSTRIELSHAVAYVPMSEKQNMTFEDVIHHEACGHGFGKLADEYTGKGSISSSEIKELQLFQAAGAYTNVDVHSDVNATLWARYALDSRFNSEKIGAYEGGYTYNYGVYRPTTTSIMVSNKGYFNAPSRAQIYSRAMSISKLWNWTFDYEDFVLFDSPIRQKMNSSSPAFSAPSILYENNETNIPLSPPVLVQNEF